MFSDSKQKNTWHCTRDTISCVTFYVPVKTLQNKNCCNTWTYSKDCTDTYLVIQTPFEGHFPRLRINSELSVRMVWRHRLNFIVERWVWRPSLVFVVGYHSLNMGACWEMTKQRKGCTYQILWGNKKRHITSLLYPLPCVASSSTLISNRSLWKRGGLSLMSDIPISTPNLVSIDESVFIASNLSYRLKDGTQH